jgi:cytochrome c-type biogenesis protein CcmH
MSLWISLGGILFVVVVVLLWPLLRQRSGGVAGADRDAAVYKDQLAQLDADLRAGLVSETDAADARAEVSRRLLAVADRADTPAADAGGRGTARLLAAAVVLALPFVSILLYSQIGAPGLPGFPFADRRAADPAGSQRLASLEDSVARLELRLVRNPQDLDGIRLLARSYMALRRFDEAARTYEKALGLAAGDADLHSAYGEALTYAAQAVVTPAARAAFDAALAKKPEDERAQLYLAVAEEQAGNRQAALDRWVALLKDAPADAPWAQTARERATAIAEALGLDPATVLPPPAQVARPGPGAGDMEAAATMSPDERRQMIETMVTRLADKQKENPDDLQGWLRLGRSYTVLARPAEARDALANAVRLAPENRDILLLYGRAMRTAAGNKQTSDSVAVMRRVLAVDPENIEALWLVGRFEAQAGDKAGLVKMQKALDRMPPDMPRRKELENHLDSLKAGKADKG